MKSYARRMLLLSCCVLVLAPATGCNVLATGMWIVNPNDVDAEYDGLTDLRVAVVCQPSSSMDLQYYGVDQELATRVSETLRANVEGIQIVSQAEIHDWTDQNQLESISEFGAAMNADVVVAIDMPDFNLQKGEGMLQGQATVDVTIFDVATGEKKLTLEPITSLYPPENGIPVDLANQRIAETKFRRRFQNNHQV